MMKKTSLVMMGLLFLVANAYAEEVDWQPMFNDKPVPPEIAAQLVEAVPTTAIVEPEAPRRVLVYSATAGFRHDSIPTGKLALEMLGEKSGAYETVISDDPANFEPEALAQFDAVILLNTTQNFFMPGNRKDHPQFTDEQWAALQARNDRLVDNLIDYVEAGGGLVGIHAATDSCYGHQAYGETIGAYFAGHPWNAGQNVTIVVEDPEHEVIKPVFSGIDDFQIKEEIYQFQDEPYSRERLRILLHLDPERSDKPEGQPRRADGDYPVAWVQSVGDGRVFYTSLGHRHDIYTNPLLLKHYLAGIQFATGDLPADTTPSALIAVPHVGQP